MKTEFIPKIITLLAGAVVSITCIVRDIDVTRSLEMLLATLILFYIIGCFVRRLIERVLISNSVLKKEVEKQLNEDIETDDNDKDDSGKQASKNETGNEEQSEN